MADAEASHRAGTVVAAEVARHSKPAEAELRRGWEDPRSAREVGIRIPGDDGHHRHYHRSGHPISSSLCHAWHYGGHRPPQSR